MDSVLFHPQPHRRGLRLEGTLSGMASSKRALPKISCPRNAASDSLRRAPKIGVLADLSNHVGSDLLLVILDQANQPSRQHIAASWIPFFDHLILP
jgi:hypothetical protein